MEISDTSAVIAGGTSGLGLAIARLLRQRGVSVVLLGRNEKRGSEAAGHIGAIYSHGDVCNHADVGHAIREAAALAPLRSLVVCAGIGHAERTVGRDGSFASAHDLDAFRQVLETNLVGTFNCVRLGATAIAQTAPDESGHRGAIVLTSSLAARAGQVGQAAYAASKAGIEGMVLPLARDLASAGIRVNAIRPGGFDTPIYGQMGVSDDLRQKISRHTVFPRRMGQPAEFASLAMELLTNGYLNACTVDLDAGTRVLPR